MRECAGQIPENSSTLVSAILTNVIGHPADALEHIKGIGMNNAVTLASTAEGRFVVRTNVESHLFRFQREAWCFKQLEATPVPTPQVLGCGILDGHSYSVAPFIDGSQPIDDSDDQLRVWRTLGHYAYQLNQIYPSPAEAAAYFPMTWEQQVTSEIDLIFSDDLWLDKGLLNSEQQEFVQHYLRGCGRIESPRGVCQFDLTVANAVICRSDDAKIYLLDLESANTAPVPYYQVGCIVAEKGPESAAAQAFFEGYGIDSENRHGMESELERFVLYRLMRATAWARDRYPALLEENLRRTRPVLACVLGRLLAE